MSQIIGHDDCISTPWFSTARVTEVEAIAGIFEHAHAASRAGQWKRAAELFRTMGRLAPELAAAHLGLAAAELAAGNASAATEALRAAIEIQPDSCELQLQLGVLLAHAGLVRDAEDAFVRVLDIDEDNLDALLSLAQICRAQRCFVEALTLLEKANGSHPNNADVVAALGAVAVELGDWVSARELLAKLSELAPAHVERDTLAQRIAEGQAFVN